MFPSTDHKMMKHSLLDSSLHDASNGGIFVSLEWIDTDLFMIYCLQTFMNISVSIGARDMILPPYDASSYDNSNELSIAFL